MPTVLQFRRGTTSQNNSFTGTVGEISVDTTLDTLRVHDNSTAGGFEITSNAATQTLTNKTLTSVVLNTGVSGTAVLDEDNLASDSATQLATQQSIKAYVDGEIGSLSSTLTIGADTGSNDTVTVGTDTLSFTGGTGVDTTVSNNDISFAIDSTVATLTGSQVLTNKTLTSPKIGTNILDANGNELLVLTATASAVNEITYANAATGNGPTLTASGGDTNIDVSILPKGSGQVIIDNLTFPAADGTADQILVTDGSGNLSFVDNSGGTSWVAVKTAGFTAVAGEGYFCDTTSAAFTMTLPAGTLGDEISFVDYAGTFDTNTLTVAPNGAEKIQGVAASLTISVERAANTLVYTDGTQGWLLKAK